MRVVFFPYLGRFLALPLMPPAPLIPDPLRDKSPPTAEVVEANPPVREAGLEWGLEDGREDGGEVEDEGDLWKGCSLTIWTTRTLRSKANLDCDAEESGVTACASSGVTVDSFGGEDDSCCCCCCCCGCGCGCAMGDCKTDGVSSGCCCCGCCWGCGACGVIVDGLSCLLLMLLALLLAAAAAAAWLAAKLLVSRARTAAAWLLPVGYKKER